MNRIHRNNSWKWIRGRRPGETVAKIAPVARWVLVLSMAILSLGVYSYAVYMTQYMLGVTPYPPETTAAQR